MKRNCDNVDELYANWTRVPPNQQHQQKKTKERNSRAFLFDVINLPIFWVEADIPRKPFGDFCIEYYFLHQTSIT